MTTTTSEATRFTVGQRLHSHEEINALPVGTTIRPWSDVNSTIYTRHADGWASISMPTPRDGEFLSTDGYNEIVSLPGQPFAVGTAITSLAMWEALPLGTHIRMREESPNRWIIADGQIVSTVDGNVNRLSQARTDGELVVESYPTALEPVVRSDSEPVDYSAETPSAGAETLTRFKQRFRTITFGVAQRASVAMAPLENGMRALHVPDPDPCPGMVFEAADTRLKARFVSGTVVEFGTDNTDVDRWSLYGYSAPSDWTRLLGNRQFSGEGVIRSVPGVITPSWVTEPAHENSAVHILQFKQQAWTLGVKAKASNSWCTDYETAMRRLQIDESIMDEVVAPLSHTEEVAAMPMGTIVRYADSRGSVLYRRDDASTNPSRTVRIGGSLSGHWAQYVSVVRLAGADTPIKALSTEEADGMPDGTTCADGSTIYTRSGENRLWRVGTTTTGYGYNAISFTLSTLTYRTFP